MLAYILLVVGFVLLIKGADFFVDGSSSVAKLIKIPAIVIGLTVVAFGTSMPEASVSITAALQGKNNLAVSNVIGSNIFNLLIVLGVSSLLQPILARASVIKKEFPFSIVITIVLLIMIGGGFQSLTVQERVFTLGRVEGGILLLGFVFFLVSTVKNALKSRKEERNSYLEEERNQEYKILSPARTAVYMVGGLAGIIYGGDLVVKSASEIAVRFGLSQTFIGLTIVAIGTSLPELVTSMVAASKGENDLALGNVVGSNIFNILLILGASALISPIQVDVNAVYDTVILIVVSVIGWIFAWSKGRLSKKEGVLMLLLYVGFFAYIFTR